MSELNTSGKWNAIYRQTDVEHSGPVLSDFFKIRRGIATGSNKFFVMTVDEAQGHGFNSSNLTPLLPSPRYIKEDVVEPGENGYPNTNPQLVVLNATESIEELRNSDPNLARYFEAAPEEVLSGFLVSQRRPWYRQEIREPAPFLLTYMGRGSKLERPFKFILNNSTAIVTNMYLMLYPGQPLQQYMDSDPAGKKKVHEALLSLTGEDLRSGGRVYGGGLHKMEPKELAKLNATAIAELCPELLSPNEHSVPTA